MSSTLPAPVQGYITTSNAFDGDALIECFAPRRGCLPRPLTDGIASGSGTSWVAPLRLPPRR